MKPFTIKGLDEEFVSFDTLGDGSCLLHSILFCFNKKYRNGNIMERLKITKNLRNCFSKVLEETNKETNKTYYEELSRGEIKNLSKFLPEMRLDFMQKYLNSQNYLNFYFLELISNQLDIDIYIINSEDGTIYMNGDKDLFYKNRKSVIIKYIDQVHFESVGFKGEKIETLFDKNCYIIKELRNIIDKRVD